MKSQNMEKLLIESGEKKMKVRKQKSLENINESDEELHDSVY